MNFLSDAYHKALTENEKNLRFWENYLQNLKGLDFSEFSNKLKVPALVPIGSRILFRGELKHTNELIVSLGADYFVKCSLKQADVLRLRRIKDAQSKLDTYIKEKEYLENKLNFSKQNVCEFEGKEIIEYQTEEDDKVWREKHREHVRQYKQKKQKEEDTPKEEITDEELWNRLDELELQEELENEFYGDNSSEDSFIIKEDFRSSYIDKQSHNDIEHQEGSAAVEDLKDQKEKSNSSIKGNDNGTEKMQRLTFQTPAQTPKLDLLQQVIDRQNQLESKLLELKNRERSQTKTEQDLISKLDEMEQLDELEDEMDRLDDIIEKEDDEDDDDDDDDDEDEDDHNDEVKSTKHQRRVSFVDEYNNETLELTFEHSPVEPNNDTYDPAKGIVKPSDIYQAYPNLFGKETISILKKSKYENLDRDLGSTPNKDVAIKKVVHADEMEDTDEIIIKDVFEKVDQNRSKLESQARPTSLFKKQRMLKKS